MYRSDDELLTLLGLRLLGFAPSAAIADRIGLPVDSVERELASAAEHGRAVHRSGGRPGWTLTPEGRRHGEALLAVELDRAGAEAAVDRAYRSFLPLNRDLLDTCARWQVKDPAGPVLNDHTDAAYDRAMLDRLSGIDAHIQPICAELGRCLARFDRYGPRLTFALDRVNGGDLDWFTKPLIESYHTVWFELHEDLLATLGLDRTTEPATLAGSNGSNGSGRSVTANGTNTGPPGQRSPAARQHPVGR